MNAYKYSGFSLICDDDERCSIGDLTQNKNTAFLSMKRREKRKKKTLVMVKLNAYKFGPLCSSEYRLQEIKLYLQES